jgi:hypothetical protein
MPRRKPMDVATEDPQLTSSVVRPGKRFNLNLSPEAYQDMEELSNVGSGRTMSEVFRLALSLLKAVYPGMVKGQELYLVDPGTNTERQIVLPK